MARCAVRLPALSCPRRAGCSNIPLAKSGKAPAGTSQRNVPTKAPEARQIVAHGETVGFGRQPHPSPGWGDRKPAAGNLLSPHPGLYSVCAFNPRLAPWATFYRRSATFAKNLGIPLISGEMAPLRRLAMAWCRQALPLRGDTVAVCRLTMALRVVTVAVCRVASALRCLAVELGRIALASRRAAMALSAVTLAVWRRREARLS